MISRPYCLYSKQLLCLGFLNYTKVRIYFVKQKQGYDPQCNWAQCAAYNRVIMVESNGDNVALPMLMFPLQYASVKSKMADDKLRGKWTPLLRETDPLRVTYQGDLIWDLDITVPGTRDYPPSEEEVIFAAEILEVPEDGRLTIFFNRNIDIQEVYDTFHIEDFPSGKAIGGRKFSRIPSVICMHSY